MTAPAPPRPGFGVMLSVFDSMGAGLPSVAASARLAEDLGFDSLWAGDHLFFHRPNLDAMIVLAAAAGATSRIALAPGVLLPALRHPVVVAKQVSSLAVLSGERLILGVGVGGEYPAEWDAVGVDLRERGARTDESLELLRTALGGGPIEHRSTHFDVRAPAMLPAPSTPDAVPIWVGGRSDAALRRTVRFGAGWITVWTSVRRLQEAQEQLAELVAQAGRTEPVRTALLVFASIGPKARARDQAEAFVRGHYQLPFEKMERWVLHGEKREIAESLAEFRDAGVEDFVVYPAAPDPSRDYEAVREVFDLVPATT